MLNLADVPRKGNVDRNSLTAKISLDRLRDVPRKGNVDRNLAALVGVVGNTATFPARGTWIEISSAQHCVSWRSCETFPARGTWIEMPNPRS